MSADYGSLNGFHEYADSFIGLLPVRPVHERKILRQRPVSLLLYDSESSMSFPLTGTIEETEAADFRKPKSARPAVSLGLHGIVLTRPAELGTDGLAFIGLYPYRIGRESFRTFGLIAIVILTILLLWFAVSNTTVWLKSREVVFLEDHEKGPDIVDEIDQEISGEEKKKETGTEQKPEEEESPSIKEEGGKEEPVKMLEEDGIFIEK